MTSQQQCSLDHYVIWLREGNTVKCTNRLCYEPIIKGTDVCLLHHLRDECPK